jgi:L-ribulokinase
VLTWHLQQVLAQSTIINAETAKALIEETADKLIPELSKQAALIEIDENSELAVDWFNGRRTPDASQELKGAFTALNLGSDAPRMFRAIVEATCFGAKAIVDRFNQEGVPVKGLIGLGGVAKKSPFIMQMMADVMNMPIRIHKSEQTCALGAAMFAATAAGIYNKVEDAMNAMGQGFDATYYPDKTKVALYQLRYKKYHNLGGFIENSIKTKAKKEAFSN